MWLINVRNLGRRLSIIFLMCHLYAISYSQEQKPQSFASIIVDQGKLLLGQQYKANSLEATGKEKLIYFDDVFDCVTFVEYVLAKSWCMYTNQDNTAAFEATLKNLRYRDGVISGYGSRLHYFSEWILQNEAKGYFRNMTWDFGGIPYNKPIKYMTKNIHLYPKLINNRGISIIRKSEKRIMDGRLFYIPKLEVRKMVDEIQSGDIIAFTASQSDLDIVHTGFAVAQNDDIYILHASLELGKVGFSKEPLVEYLMKNQKQSGIMVLRPTTK